MIAAGELMIAVGVLDRSQQLHLPLFSLFVSQQLHLFCFEFMFFTMHWLSGITAKAIGELDKKDKLIVVTKSLLAFEN